MSAVWRAWLRGQNTTEVPLWVQDVDLDEPGSLVLGTHASRGHVCSHIGTAYHIDKKWLSDRTSHNGLVPPRKPVMQLSKTSAMVFDVAIRGPAIQSGSDAIDLGRAHVIRVQPTTTPNDGWINLVSDDDSHSALVMTMRARASTTTPALDVFDVKVHVIMDRFEARSEELLRTVALRMQHTMIAAIGEDENDEEKEHPNGSERVLDTWWRGMEHGVQARDAKSRQALKHTFIDEHTNNDRSPVVGMSGDYSDRAVIGALSQSYALDIGASLFTTQLGSTLLTQSVSPAKTMQMAPAETTTSWIQSALSEDPGKWNEADDAFHHRMIEATSSSFFDRLKSNVSGGMKRATELLLPKKTTLASLWTSVKRGTPGAVQGAFKSQTAAALAKELVDNNSSMAGMSAALLQAMGRDAQRKVSGGEEGALADLANVGADKLPELRAKATVVLEDAKPVLKSMVRQFQRVDASEISKWANNVVKMIPDKEKLDGLYSLFSKMAKAAPAAAKQVVELTEKASPFLSTAGRAVMSAGPAMTKAGGAVLSAVARVTDEEQ